jgi:hypothetical protein
MEDNLEENPEWVLFSAGWNYALVTAGVDTFKHEDRLVAFKATQDKLKAKKSKKKLVG